MLRYIHDNEGMKSHGNASTWTRTCKNSLWNIFRSWRRRLNFHIRRHIGFALICRATARGCFLVTRPSLHPTNLERAPLPYLPPGSRSYNAPFFYVNTGMTSHNILYFIGFILENGHFIRECKWCKWQKSKVLIAFVSEPGERLHKLSDSPNSLSCLHPVYVSTRAIFYFFTMTNH